MTLTSGTKFGPYEIQSPLGAGGMGEVYRAKDLRLDRTVAVKILPGHLSDNPDAKQRFDREARTISSLNHPNICTLYDVGQQEGTDFLVMEFLEGETLADRLRKGPMPIAQLLKCAIEVCDGLDRAHRSGVVHRDLKPGNIMLTKGGAKLMDFGLAKAAVASASAVSSLSMTLSTPAQSHPLTAEGTVVGTFQYMAPEQVEGREADARSDIFSLGAVLYEMATGKRAFEGKSAASTMAAILERDPAPISTIQPTTPPALERLVKTCLAKDPDERWQTAHDVKLQLKQIADVASQSSAAVEAVAPKKKHRLAIAWAVAAFAGLVALAAITWALMAEKSLPLIRAEIAAPEGLEFNISGDISGPPVISPDGRKLVFSARKSGQAAQLFVRDLESVTARPLPGTEDGRFPFWSPDSRSLGFFTNDKLKRIDIDASAPVTLCDSTLGRGGSWGADGNILAAISYNTTIAMLPASGGAPHELSKLEGTKYSSNRWPTWLPDGKHYLYVAVNHSAPTSQDTGVFYASVDGKENRFLVHTFSNALFANGYLIFERERTLLAQSFDPSTGKLSGEPKTLAETPQVDASLWRTNLSVSTNGMMIYASGAAAGGQSLAWYDRSGKVLESLAGLGSFQEVQLSPDNKKLALTDVNTVAANIWVYDLTTHLKNRLMFSGGVTRGPVWSPDGSRIAFTMNQGASMAIKPSAGGAPEQTILTVPDHSLSGVTTWSPDGRHLMYQQGYGLELQLSLLDPSGQGKPQAFAGNDMRTMSGQFSPDGRWVAYMAFMNSQPQIFVAPFPWTGEKWQVSQGYGIEPRWRGDGKEIYYFDSSGIVAVQVENSGNSFAVGTATQLFPLALPGLSAEYDVTHDGKRFIAATQSGGSTQPLTLVQNWPSQLKK
ncbi:serine/threonine protein kinase [Candidatus Koribacter versatilis Ellin345]|uniref:non-specific serine/threonine protein kinase n=1 Tax=Koribacter versatilis (strain Ellin345) TaxID=204669 RepID=Q1IJ32_KORVE|nr:protein kinase [Candidatus Koribacter versatilis]ABF43118.1 serine/threonine protein kinase [Candidatus Koribacter versatilis Ellin345]